MQQAVQQADSLCKKIYFRKRKNNSQLQISGFRLIERNVPVKLCFGIPSAVRLENRCLPHWLVICLVNSHKMTWYVWHRQKQTWCNVKTVRGTLHLTAEKFQRFTHKKIHSLKSNRNNFNTWWLRGFRSSVESNQANTLVLVLVLVLLRFEIGLLTGK